jgi:hypothetical protein
LIPHLLVAMTYTASERNGFRQLSRLVSRYEPQKHVSGEVVIISTWLSGSARHIAPYIAICQVVAPGAKILLIQSPMDSFLSPYFNQARNIRPAIENPSPPFSENANVPHSISHILQWWRKQHAPAFASMEVGDGKSAPAIWSRRRFIIWCRWREIKISGFPVDRFVEWFNCESFRARCCRLCAVGTGNVDYVGALPETRDGNMPVRL